MPTTRRSLCAALFLALPVTAGAGLSEFTYGSVELLESPFLEASRRNARYLLELEPDRLLHNTRKYAGLEPKGEIYGGWESQGIAGHTLGHYLTALSQQYAVTGDSRFGERIDYLVAEMAVAQAAYGDGYVGALPPLELETLRGLEQGEVAVQGPFNFASGAWVPWYTQHKILAGLRDAWVLGGNVQAKGVALGLADWVDAVTRTLSPEEVQTMLEVEHGGMSEVMIDLYALTGEERYRAVSERFHHEAVLAPLRSGRDELAGRHANTQIPKIIGAARSYEVTGALEDRAIAEQFWHRVVDRHSWVIGGNSEAEHFFEPETASEHLSAATAESCNTYNMLRLTEHLFQWKARVEYADYYERALYNHILASQEPDNGMYAYFMSLKPGFFRTYSTPHDSFWCCVGSGMENHTKYGRAIYFHDDDGVYVNLFIPSRLEWIEKGFVLEQRTDYPESDTIRFRIADAPGGPLALRIRAPGWAAGQLSFTLNGERLDVDARPGRFVTIRREWQPGDELTARVPMSLRTEALRGTDDTVAFLYGPVVLAGDLGPMERSETFPYAKDQWDNFEAPDIPVPALAGDPRSITGALEAVPGKPLTFRTEGVLDGEPVDIELKPYADLAYRRYNVYWTVEPAD